MSIWRPMVDEKYNTFENDYCREQFIVSLLLLLLLLSALLPCIKIMPVTLNPQSNLAKPPTNSRDYMLLCFEMKIKKKTDWWGNLKHSISVSGSTCKNMGWIKTICMAVRETYMMVTVLRWCEK